MRGAGGYGKTTLAQALCHDKRVQEVFHDGIFWVTLGEKPDNLIGILSDLIYVLSHEKIAFDTLHTATHRFVELLVDHAILLVIDDVWDATHLSPFLQGGKRCARLVTTRNAQILPAFATRINVDAMQPNEAVSLLHAGLQDVSIPHESRTWQQLAQRLGKWPLLLKLVNGVLYDRVRSGESLSAALTFVNEALDEEGLTAFDDENAQDRHRAVTNTLALSLQRLSVAERERYQELALFPEDVDIPLATVQRFWRATAGMSPAKGELLCLRLAQLSLLLDCNLKTRTIRLHDVLRAYLQGTWGQVQLEQLHSRFLDTYHLTRWSELSQEEPYIWSHLATHLLAAHRGEDLVKTVKDGMYLATKAHLQGAHAVERDLDFAELYAPEERSLHWLKQSIIAMGHLLNACASLQECACVLHSRFLHQAEHGGIAIAHSVEPFLTRSFLTALHRLPDLPSSALVRTLTGHTDIVRACAFSPDGLLILSASKDLKLWETHSGQLLRTFEGYTLCAFSPDGTCILSASDDCTLKLWEAHSGRLLHTFEGHTGSLSACTFSPDGNFILSASCDNTLRLWDVQSGSFLHTFEGHSESVNACMFSPDGNFILSASYDDTLKVWDTYSGDLLSTFEGHTSAVVSCTFSPNGSHILSGSWDHTVKLWETHSGRLVHTFGKQVDASERKPDFAKTFALSPDGTYILDISGDIDNLKYVIKLWETYSGRLVYTLEEPTSLFSLRNPVCTFSPDGFHFLTASYGRTLKLWETHSGQLVHTFDGHVGGISSCVFSPDGSRILSASNNYGDLTLKLWDVHTEDSHSFEKQSEWVGTCALNADGAYALSISDNALQLRETHSGHLLRAFEEYTGHADRLHAKACTFSPDGSRILSLYYSGTLKLWETHSGHLIHTLEGRRHGGDMCAFSPDGTHVLVATYTYIRNLWDASSEEFADAFKEQTNATSSYVLRDGTHILFSISSKLSLDFWDVHSGEFLHTLEGQTEWDHARLSQAHASDVLHDIDRFNSSGKRERGFSGAPGETHTSVAQTHALSPDGSSILSASLDYNLELRECHTGQFLRVFKGHTGQVNACAFSPDSTFVLSASSDQTLKLWETSSGQLLHTLKGHIQAVQACVFSPDGTHILSASDDQTLKLWRTQGGKCLATLHLDGIVRDCIFAPDGERLVAAGSKGLYFLRVVY